MTADEKEAWRVLLKNGMNPAHWRFQGVTAFQAHPSPGTRLYRFENNMTEDSITIEHMERIVKKMGRLYK